MGKGVSAGGGVAPSTLEDEQEEVFAQCLAAGLGLVPSYTLAGYTTKSNDTARASATALERTPHIRRRVDELLEDGARHAGLTRGWLIRQCLEISNEARNANQYSAAVSAIREAGTLSGLRVETTSQTGTTEVRVLKFTQDQIDGAEVLGLPHGGQGGDDNA